MNIRGNIQVVGDICSVIGNGPATTDLSKEIDNSFVMRCNNFWASYKIPDEQTVKNKGTRTDLNISSLYNYVAQGLPYPIFGVLPISKTLYQRYVKNISYDMHEQWQRHADKLRLYGNKVWTYNENDDYADVFRSVAEEINAFPTVGLMGIATARWLGFRKIILTGFTFYKVGAKQAMAIQHNPDAELVLVRKWIETGDSEYLLDELMNKVIYDN